MDTNQNDIRPLSYDLPYAVDITLFKYNYYDNLIISQLKKHTQLEPIPGDTSFVVTVEEFQEVLLNKFQRELDTAHSLTEITIKDGVNSIYFLDRIFNNFSNLAYVKVNISKTRQFSRLLQVANDRQVISFDYRIITSVIDFTKYFTTDESLKRANSFLSEINIIETDSFNRGKAYYTLTAQDFMTLINGIEENFMSDPTFEATYIDTLDIIYSLIDQKCESDNSRIILITDYPD
jgi:hypothetical protein